MVVLRPFYNHYIKLPPKGQTSLEIRNNPKLYPFFKDCQGAIDKTYIDVFVPKDAVVRYHNCKGGLSQNVLAVCIFNLQFSYVFPDWEGSATDGSVFDNACQESLAISPSIYLLANAGFLTCDALMILYKRDQYHLKE